MRIFEPVRGGRTGQVPTLVEQVVQAMQRAMEQQVFRAGMRVPSIRQFARMHELSTFTVSAAYGQLVAQGYLVARPGSGYWVNARPQLPDEPPVQDWQPPKVGERWLLEDVFADHSIPIKSGCGWLPSKWLTAVGLDSALRHLARIPVGQLSSYGHPYGYLPLREFLCQELQQEGWAVHPRQVLLTQGATQGLDLIVRALLKPGDTVLVEVPCYANMLSMLHMANMQVVGIERRPEGFDLKQLEEILQTQPVKAFFINPVLHNPTGSTLSMQHAFQLLKLLHQQGVLIIEDDVSRSLSTSRAPLLAAMAGGEQVVYVGSFSKNVAPSTRVGFVVASPKRIELLASRKMSHGLTTPALMERLVHQIVRTGSFKHHVQFLHSRLTQAHHQVYEAMDRLGYEVFERAYAGLFVWARPRRASLRPGLVDSMKLAQEALRAGIWLAPGSYFYPDNKDDGWLRFNVAHSQSDALWAFLAGAQGQDIGAV